MIYCESAWNLETETEVTAEHWDHSQQTLSQASPSLIRILQAVFLIQSRRTYCSFYAYENFLFKIHMMLDISWGKLRTVLCSIRPLIIGDRAEQLIRTMSIVTFDPTPFPPRFDSILWNLACGSLHVIRQVLNSEIDKNVL